MKTYYVDFGPGKPKYYVKAVTEEEALKNAVEKLIKAGGLTLEARVINLKEQSAQVLSLTIEADNCSSASD